MDKAQQVIKDERGRIDALAELLAEPKADLQPKGALPEKKGFLLPES
jgi:hypothetical protein